MSLMKFINNPETCVEDMLSGLGNMYPALYIDTNLRIAVLKKINNRVSILTGGGSGHEPFAAGFIGDGMLSGAIAGKVFASPPTVCIFNAISILSQNNNNSGVLLIVLNYTGDILNFGLATEQAKAQNIKIKQIVIGEDCSRSEDQLSKAGRRGMSGVVLLIKIAGAMAKMGKDLIQIMELCKEVIKHVACIGASVTSCTVPGTGTLFHLPSDQIEFGIGIHGEAGTLRTKKMPINELVKMMLDKIFDYFQKSGQNVENVCVVINNLGSVSQLEMGIIANEVHLSLGKLKNITVCRTYSGTWVSSLDMAGFQICLLNVTDNPEWLMYLDSLTDAPAWPNTANNISTDSQLTVPSSKENDYMVEKRGPTLNSKEAGIFKECLESLAKVLTENKNQINDLDSEAGDGDTGTTLQYLADGILEHIDKIPVDYPGACFLYLNQIAQFKMGGTLGAILSLMFTSTSNYLSEKSDLDWLGAYKHAIKILAKYNHATIGDRTMLDVIIPVYEEFDKQYFKFKNYPKAFIKASSIAIEKSKETKHMHPKAGRASYVAEKNLKNEDAGAHAVALCFQTLSSVLENYYK